MFCVERRQVWELDDRLGNDAGRDFWGFFEGGKGGLLPEADGNGRGGGVGGRGSGRGGGEGFLSAPDGSQAPLRRIFIPRHHRAKQ